MKFLPHKGDYSGTKSHPTRGGWIEIIKLGMEAAKLKVPPHKGWVD